MIYLILAICASMLVSVVMRLSEGRAKSGMSKLAVNYLMCTLLSVCYAGTMDFLPRTEGIGYALALGAVSGALYLGSFALLQWNIRVNGVVLPATFMKLGVVVPTLLAVVLFGETPRLAQVLGVLGAIAAILLIQMEKGQSRAKHALGLVVLWLGGGVTDTMAKFFDAWGSPALENHYLLYTFVTALLLCAALVLVRREKMTLADVGFGLLLGIPNYYSARFLLLSLSQVPAVVAYPTYSVGTIVLVALAGRMLFGEKLSRRQLLAMGMILVSLVLLNV
ncbi:MAG: hypothetical protein IKK34_02610 [Clostridia bacterium]|nr:hypothetical protein [Clostridia bacterium]